MARKCPELPNLKKFYYELFLGHHVDHAILIECRSKTQDRGSDHQIERQCLGFVLDVGAIGLVIID